MFKEDICAIDYYIEKGGEDSFVFTPIIINNIEEYNKIKEKIKMN